MTTDPRAADQPTTAADTAYETWVGRVADALHETCLNEWRAIVAVDPQRQFTQHMVDAHWGMAHDLVRRLGLAELPEARADLAADNERLRAALDNLATGMADHCTQHEPPVCGVLTDALTALSNPEAAFESVTATTQTTPDPARYLDLDSPDAERRLAAALAAAEEADCGVLSLHPDTVLAELRKP
jgi:hypothetical protein